MFPTFSALQSVQVTNPDHPRHDQAGAVMEINEDADGNVTVRFDSDLAVEPVAVTDIRGL
jgi:cell division septation protein DedD